VQIAERKVWGRLRDCRSKIDVIDAAEDARDVRRNEASECCPPVPGDHLPIYFSSLTCKATIRAIRTAGNSCPVRASIMARLLANGSTASTSP
jgi:hypothetical protein